MHIFKLKFFTKDAILSEEVIDLTLETLDHVLTSFNEFLVFFWEFLILGLLKLIIDFYEFLSIITMMRKMFEYFLSISESRIKTFSPVDHKEGVFPVLDFLFLEDLMVVDVGHFPGEFTDGKLAMSIEIGKGRLVFPILCILFEEGLDVKNLCFS